MGLPEIYSKLLEVERKVDAAAVAVPDHEARIRSLEAWKYGIPLSAVLAAGALLARLITK